jgi:RND family efflux transporter MFP subunit
MTNFIKLIIFLLFTLAYQSMLVAQGMGPANVNVAIAEVRSLSPYAWVSGTIVSRNNSRLAPEVSGRLIELANLGLKVKKGDIIAMIDDRSLQNTKRELTAALASAKTNHKYLSSEVARIQSLANKNLSSQNDLDRSVLNRDIAFGELSEAQARLSQVNQNIDDASLKAPFDGLVTHRLSNIGEYVNSGTAIINLVETAQLEVSAFAPLPTYQYLKEASVLAIESPLGTGNARIKALIPVADSRSHLMEIRLDMTDFDWPVGLTLKVAVTNGKQQDVLAVPRDALVLRREGVSIFKVAADNTAQQVRVTLGIGAGELVQIIGDLEAGDRVIIRGAERLNDGQAVKVNPSNDKLISGATK